MSEQPKIKIGLEDVKKANLLLFSPKFWEDLREGEDMDKVRSLAEKIARLIQENINEYNLEQALLALRTVQVTIVAIALALPVEGGG